MRHAKPTEIPELEPLEYDLPPRSVLYRIPPLGAGTGQVEGLLSYLVRLAAAHSVNPRRMVREVFAADNPEFAKLYSAGFFIRHAGTINGLGKYAELFLKEVEKLTGADILRPMTLLPLQALLPPNGQGLLTRHPRWCPSCLQEMVKSGEAYRPLVWSFELYGICVRHGVRMAEACPHCGQAQPFIPRYPDLARCDHCGRALWNGRLPKMKTSAQDRWVAEAVEDLVAHLADLDGMATVERWRDIVRAAVSQTAGGNRAKFCRRCGTPRWAATGWLSGGENPTFPQLLTICHGLGIMPSTLFLRDAVGLAAFLYLGSRAPPRKLCMRAERPLLSVHERRRLRKQMERIASDAEDVRPIAAVLKALSLTRSCAKYWFPGAYATIVAKSRLSRKHQRQADVQRGCETVKSVVRGITARGEYPSRRRVNAELTAHRLSLARSDMLAAYHQALKAV